MSRTTSEAGSTGQPEHARKGIKLTPVMQQYAQIKSEHEDAVLLFRMGDFYEMFFEDAEKAAGILDIALTSRNRNDEHPIPMCGVPHHSVRGYVAKLLEAGVKVALCEQMELPRKGIARREVTRIVTPGTSLDEETLAPDCGNYLASVRRGPGCWALAWAEFSTGELRVTDAPSLEAIADEVAAVGPSELLVDETVDDGALAELRTLVPRCMVTRLDVERVGQADHSAATVSVATAATWAPGRLPAEVPAACRETLRALVSYIDRTQGGRTAHLGEPVYYEAAAYLQIDHATRRNLELVEAADGGRRGTLLSVTDRSVTPMGKRLARDWLLRPLADTAAIGRRLDAVERLVDRYGLRADLRESLRAVGDIGRLGGRLGAGTAGARDLVRLATSLEAIVALRARLAAEDALPDHLAEATGQLDTLDEARALIGCAIADDPPLAIGRGPTIRPGYHEEVDRLRAISSDGKGWMAELEARERERTGIARLKIGYNKVFGYFIEVSRAAQAKVPDDYERKQTVANAERYVTAELKRREAEMLGAEERLSSLETHLLGEILSKLSENLPALANTAAAIAVLDVLAGFAETAHSAALVRPRVCEDGALEIVEGRHPVVEAGLGSRFVPNDCRLSPDQTLVMVITGPNMAGKSTYLRQVALITLLAHCGAFVPATSARIPLVDRVFTRIGASDNLTRGQSTFMVEMTETANILRSMTDRSLVVLDEIGRGTSTFDGISIAWAVAEAMVRGGVKTLFATHYHELAGLAVEHDRVANHSVAVRRFKGEIVFLYRVVEGAASGSYGIEVAKLAGVPERVIEDARRMLDHFENEPVTVREPEVQPQQPSLFGSAAFGEPKPGARAGARPAREEAPDRVAAEVLVRLRGLDLERTTPLEALGILAELVGSARSDDSC